MLLSMEGELHFTLTKKERLTGKNKIENLFTNGRSFIAYPLRIVFIECECCSECLVSILVSVPKKRLKLAVQRNQIKRLVRESYRQNKNILTENLSLPNKQLNIAFVYVKDEVTDYVTIEKSMRKALNEMVNQLMTKDK
jgi:ribonuclease P protein component